MEEEIQRWVAQGWVDSRPWQEKARARAMPAEYTPERGTWSWSDQAGYQWTPEGASSAAAASGDQPSAKRPRDGSEAGRQHMEKAVEAYNQAKQLAKDPKNAAKAKQAMSMAKAYMAGAEHALQVASRQPMPPPGYTGSLSAASRNPPPRNTRHLANQPKPIAAAPPPVPTHSA
jgi:hypothetical protein